jgi:hypothetical protein
MFSAFMSYCNTLFQTVSGNSRRQEAKKETSKGPVVLRTNDVVNAELARGWCEELGLDLQVTDQRDELFPLESSAAVIDLDHLSLTVNERAELVERLSCVLPPYPVAIASYDLDARIIAAFRAHGVVVCRRIDPHLFHELAAVLDRKLAASSA